MNQAKFYVVVKDVNNDQLFVRFFPKFTDRLSRLHAGGGLLIICCKDPYDLINCIQKLDQCADYELLEQLDLCAMM